MWPLLLDMTKEESLQSLRCLELEAYSSLVTALRAQGPLNPEKMKILKDTCALLNITQDRHKAEVRRVVNDEKLNTIAYHVSGQRTTSDEWAIEGRRLCPLMPRVAPQTAFSAIADEVADSTSKINKQLPSPSSTERKRPPVSVAQCPMPEPNKTVFRVPEPPKSDDNTKKRKLPVGVENSSLAQHLMGSPKMSRIQQIYRQKTKARQKEQHLQMKLKQEQDLQNQKALQQFQQQHLQQKFPQKLPVPSQSSAICNSKINILQNISIPTTLSSDIESAEQKTDSNCTSQKPIEKSNILPQTSSSTDSQVIKAKPLLNNTKLSQHITLKHVPSTSPGPSADIPKTLKVCPARKTITTKSVAAGQKLIVVSNPQSVSNPSILHRTLTIPFVKNLSMKNFDKFKIVNPTSSTIQLTPISNTITTNSTKHKVVTVRTNQAVKKVIPLSQLQVLNAKGSIKVLPIGGKIVTKSNPNSTTAPIFIVNTANNVPALTKSTTSTPVVMSCKMEESEIDTKPLLVMENSDNAICSTALTETDGDSVGSTSADALNACPQECESKSSVLAEIMEASDESYTDFESQITQHTIQQLVADGKIKAADCNESLSGELCTEQNLDTNTNSVKSDDVCSEDQGDSVEMCQNEQIYAEQESSVDSQIQPFEGEIVNEELCIKSDDVDNEEHMYNNEPIYKDVASINHEVQYTESMDGLNLTSLPAEASTIYILDSEHSNDEVLNSFQIRQSSDILSIVGVNHQNNDKFSIESTESECVEMETVPTEGDYMEMQEIDANSDN